MTTNSRWTPQHEYAGVITQMIEACGGLNNQTQMSIKRMVEILDLPYGMIANLRKASGMAGGLQTDIRGGPKDQRGGRNAFWTWVHTEEWIEAQMMKKWGAPLTCNGIENIMPNARPPRKAAVPKAEPWELPPVIDDKAEPTEMEVKLKAAGVSTKLSDAEALIEAARQYMGREEFIAEELKRFADMGITIDESAIHVEKDERLEGVVPLIEYIDTLARLIDRQADSLEKVQQTGASADKVTQLQRDVYDAKEDARKTRHAYEEYKSATRTKMNTKDHQIQRLRTEVEDLATKNLQLIGGKS